MIIIFEPPLHLLMSDNNYGMSQFDDFNSRFDPSIAIIIFVVMTSLIIFGFVAVYISVCLASERDTDSLEHPSSGQRQERLSQGLDKAMIASLPCLRYSSVQKGKQEKVITECPVCLTEFGENEYIRFLPRCGHAFHLDCIDMWLFSHSNCPLCRRSLLPLTNYCHTFEMDIESAVFESRNSRLIGRSSHSSPEGPCELSVAINDAAAEPNNINKTSDRVTIEQSSLVVSRDLEEVILEQLLASREGKRACRESASRRSYSAGASNSSEQKALRGTSQFDPNLNMTNRLIHAKSCSNIVDYVI
ncbi:hypothetical protein O6H91_15G086200 [Diphasiastrum complanatum]|uniref:Uncharacterized protein n=1 Tax=Diphasiastrum complanatum TaxID=34168 RepID=A0ACC2BKK4_DIPCM|nr:hypothetical protein O6H91_15G086200 [Diphasiastrum complanatum]